MKLATIVLVALTILGEARNQPRDGQACVALTIRNRMELSGWTAEEVIFQPHQYRMWDKDVVAEGYRLRQRWLFCMVWDEFPDNAWCMEPLLKIGSAEQWREVYGLAEAVVEGNVVPEGCEDVTHYDNIRKFWDGQDPPWAANMVRTVCIADHCFYRYK